MRAVSVHTELLTPSAWNRESQAPSDEGGKLTNGPHPDAARGPDPMPIPPTWKELLPLPPAPQACPEALGPSLLQHRLLLLPRPPTVLRLPMRGGRRLGRAGGCRTRRRLLRDREGQGARPSWRHPLPARWHSPPRLLLLRRRGRADCCAPDVPPGTAAAPAAARCARSCSRARRLLRGSRCAVPRGRRLLARPRLVAARLPGRSPLRQPPGGSYGGRHGSMRRARGLLRSLPVATIPGRCWSGR